MLLRGKKVRIYSQSLYNCWGMYIFDYPKNKRELKKNKYLKYCKK